MTDVVHVPDQQRFQLELDGGTAVLTYVVRGDEAVFEHTLVPPAHQGRGTGALLTKQALQWAALEGLAVVPQCWYVAKWLRDHPGEVDVEVR